MGTTPQFPGYIFWEILKLKKSFSNQERWNLLMGCNWLRMLRIFLQKIYRKSAVTATAENTPKTETFIYPQNKVNIMYGYIYKIENKINGKVYIGQTTRNPQTRKREHLTKLIKNTHHNLNLMIDFEEYGAFNFKFTIIAVADNQNKLNKLEKKHILLFNSLDEEYGYNLKDGGSNGKHDEKSCLQLSRKRMGDSNPFYGLTHTIHARKLMSNSNAKNNFGFVGIKLLKNVNPENKPWYSRIQYKGYEKSLGTFHDPLSGELVYKFVVETIQ